jgi:hypothetical protein
MGFAIACTSGHQRPPNSLEGRKKSARIKASIPSTTMPTIRNGMESSQIKGNSTSITTLHSSGQHSTHRMAQQIMDWKKNWKKNLQIYGAGAKSQKGPRWLWTGNRMGNAILFQQSCSLWHFIF